MDFSILKHWVENRQLLCRFSLSLFQALGSWGRARGGGTLSVVGDERKRRASEEKMWETVSVVEGERGKKRGKTVSVVGGERKSRASGIKMGTIKKVETDTT